jgi:putative transposase
MVQELLREIFLTQVFKEVSTSEEGSYIEAYYSNVQRKVVERIDIDTLWHASIVSQRYRQ